MRSLGSDGEPLTPQLLPPLRSPDSAAILARHHRPFKLSARGMA